MEKVVETLISDLREVTELEDNHVMLVESTVETHKITAKNLLKGINERVDNIVVNIDEEKEELINDVNSVKENLTNSVNNLIGEVDNRLDEFSTSLEHLESEVNELKEGNINIDLTNYATKTELSKKLDKSELNGAINTALESAKNSGEFKGQDGYTPIKGIDYFTETDKGELLKTILQSLPTWEGGSY